MFQRVVPRVLKAKAFTQRNLSKIQSWNSSTVNKSFSTFLEKEHGEETIYMRRMEAMEAERQKAMRDRIEHIMALEHDHEDKKQLEDLLTAKKVKPQGPLALLSDWKFALPVGMLFAIPALSNEVLVLDAETQLVACFILFCSTMYTQVGGMMAKGLDDYSKQIENDLKKVDDAMFEQIQSAVEADTKALTLEEDFKQYYALADQLAIAQADVLNHQAEHQFRDAIVKKLESLAALEESATAAIRARMLKEVKAEVISTFQNDEKVKDAALKNAMAVLAGGASAKRGADVVGQVFKGAVRNYKAKYEKMPEGSDPILVQLEKDMQAIAVAPTVEGSGGNVYNMLKM